MNKAPETLHEHLNERVTRLELQVQQLTSVLKAHLPEIDLADVENLTKGELTHLAEFEKLRLPSTG